eukprot:scaffold4870_cov106-Isochrysis_galbana.AAC.1
MCPSVAAREREAWAARKVAEPRVAYSTTSGASPSPSLGRYTWSTESGSASESTRSAAASGTDAQAPPRARASASAASARATTSDAGASAGSTCARPHARSHVAADGGTERRAASVAPIWRHISTRGEKT